MSDESIYIIQVEETVRVSVTYSIMATSKDDALTRFKAGDLGWHIRDQDSEPETILVTHHETAEVFDFTHDT